MEVKNLQALAYNGKHMVHNIYELNKRKTMLILHIDSILHTMHMHYKLDFRDKDIKTGNEFRSRPHTKKMHKSNNLERF